MKYLKSLTLLILLAAALFSSSCDWMDEDSIARSEIREIIYDLERNYNWGDITGFMDLHHPDYLHKGRYRWQARDLWLDRMAEYSLMDASVIYIDIDGNYATVNMTIKLMSAEGDQTLHEPAASGDISYFYYDGSKWSIYGNQRWVK